MLFTLKSINQYVIKKEIYFSIKKKKKKGNILNNTIITLKS
jgi:hypothetical protein